MGCTVREKHVRTNRRSRSVKPEPDHSSANANGTAENSSSTKTGIEPRSYQSPSSAFDDNGWGYCTEEQLEEILFRNLEYLYNDAIHKLMALGYDEEVALRAILRNGHCYGGMDVLTNILHNSLAYLNCGSTTGANEDEPEEPSFSDLRQLEEYSLACMVCLLQQAKPHMSRGDAMWCLLMSDLHVGRASVMEIPVWPSAGGSSTSGHSNCESALLGSSSSPHEVVVSNGGPIGVPPSLCRFHGGWGFSNGSTSKLPANEIGGFFSYASEMALQREIECPKRFNLSPSMKSLLKRNVAMFAAGFRANAKQFYGQPQACPSSLFGVNSSVPFPASDATHHSKNQDVVNSIMSNFKNLNLNENTENVPEDQKDEMILSLVHQVKDLETQVKERKEWAHQKAMQAARKLSHDLTELKTLRMERDETQRLKKGKQTLEETTMKRLSDMESALRMASGQVDRANAVVRKLETENAEIRAEMEASKLSASESVTMCLEVAKREKKCLKKLLVWEKQRAKVQEEIAAEKQRITELERELARVEADTKDTEARWREERKAKEHAAVQMEEERRLKEASESNNKRNLEALRLKIEIDFQRHKDDLQRLEQEHARVKAQSEAQNPSKGGGETIASLPHEVDPTRVEDSGGSCDRSCMICMKGEVSIVFLPCAHLVICAACKEGYYGKNKVACPVCRVPIEQRIRVYGATSS